MSLSGSVEDLPLLEILQVVAFCQKTGYLTVQAPEGDAAVVFREGRVVSGYMWDVPPLDPAATPPGEARQEAIRSRITSTLERLVRLREGEFGFNVVGAAPTRIGGRDLKGETLEDGINPEGLMLDLARKLDEDRRESTAAIEASFSAPPAPETPDDDEPLEELALEDLAEKRPEPGSTVLLVDDEPDVRRLVGEQLRAAGFAVKEATDAREGRLEAARLAQAGGPFLIVTDLGLPSLGGTNFRGGLEVVSHAAAFEPRPRVLLMAERADERLRAKARRLGASILALKPGLSKLDPLQYEADLRVFGRKLARDLVPRLQKRGGPPAPAPAPPAAPSPADEATRSAALRRALDELDGHPEPDLVAFLLLRAARAFLPRAVLLLVKDDQLRGLAGFGPTDSGTSLDVLARDLSVSLDRPSPFAEAVAVGRPWIGPLPTEGPMRDLLGDLGALQATTGTVVPVRAQQGTIAILFGDNPGGQPLPALDPLVAFSRRAGRALDEAFLGQPAGAVPA
ncbi:MAG: response regulator [Acidobacteria bacterium]|nr:response regulator [Acidobacteriota bacterium]